MGAKNEFLELRVDGVRRRPESCRGGIVASTRKPDLSRPRQIPGKTNPRQDNVASLPTMAESRRSPVRPSGIGVVLRFTVACTKTALAAFELTAILARRTRPERGSRLSRAASRLGRASWRVGSRSLPSAVNAWTGDFRRRPDQVRGARNLFDRRSWLGSSGEEPGGKLRFLSAALWPARNTGALLCKPGKAASRMVVTAKEDFEKKIRRAMREPQNDARKNSLRLSKAHPQIGRMNMNRLMDGLIVAGTAHS